MVGSPTRKAPVVAASAQFHAIPILLNHSVARYFLLDYQLYFLGFGLELFAQGGYATLQRFTLSLPFTPLSLNGLFPGHGGCFLTSLLGQSRRSGEDAIRTYVNVG